VGIMCDEDVVRRRELFGANHIEKPEHDWVDLTSTVVEHHPIIWFHICKFDVLISLLKRILFYMAHACCSRQVNIIRIFIVCSNNTHTKRYRIAESVCDEKRS
jgi:hypothetical protein